MLFNSHDSRVIVTVCTDSAHTPNDKVSPYTHTHSLLTQKRFDIWNEWPRCRELCSLLHFVHGLSATHRTASCESREYAVDSTFHCCFRHVYVPTFDSITIEEIPKYCFPYLKMQIQKGTNRMNKFRCLFAVRLYCFLTNKIQLNTIRMKFPLFFTLTVYVACTVCSVRFPLPPSRPIHYIRHKFGKQKRLERCRGRECGGPPCVCVCEKME